MQHNTTNSRSVQNSAGFNQRIIICRFHAASITWSDALTPSVMQQHSRGLSGRRTSSGSTRHRIFCTLGKRRRRTENKNRWATGSRHSSREGAPTIVFRFPRRMPMETRSPNNKKSNTLLSKNSRKFPRTAAVGKKKFFLTTAAGGAICFFCLKIGNTLIEISSCDDQRSIST